MSREVSLRNELIDIKKKQWRKFIETGAIDPAVKPYIAESWKRCVKYGVDYKGTGHGVRIPEKRFAEILRKNRELLEMAKPIIEMINKAFNNLHMLISVCDSDGNILYTLDTSGEKRSPEEGTLWTGYNWSEEVVGTNGATLCMLLDEPVITHSADHFCEKHHDFACADAPIHDAEGRVIGALLTTFYVADYSEFAIGVVAAGADAIEKQICFNLLNNSMRASFNNSKSGVLLLDGKMRIIYHNRAVETILNRSGEEIDGCDIGNIMVEVPKFASNRDLKEIVVKFKCGGNKEEVSCRSNIYCEAFDGKISSTVIMFEKEKSFNARINRIVGNESRYRFEDIITESSNMKAVIEQGRKIAGAEGSVLITGESGTGKELFAHSIHSASRRSEGPFVAINCAALPQSLIESELFGYEKGAFTGAKKEGYMGKFELADGGTLFLDEVGELPLDVQAKLLRALDNKCITRIGGYKEKQVDVRIVAATNRNLSEEVHRRNFRLDLLYRLSVFPVKLPPLTERKEDIIPLAKFFIDKLNRENPDKNIQPSEEFLLSLKKGEYEGNIRELQNTVIRAYYLCGDDSVINGSIEIGSGGGTDPGAFGTVHDDAEDAGAVSGAEAADGGNSLYENEEMLIRKVMNETNGNITSASEILGISRPTLYRKLNKYGIKRN